MRLLAALVCVSPLHLIAAAPAAAQPAGHGHHPPRPDQKLYLQYRVGSGDSGTSGEVPLLLPSPSAPADLDHAVTLPAPLPSIRFKRYLPNAVIEQNVVPAQGAIGLPAVQVSIDGTERTK